ncbi:MAG TPA: DUF502 domain-containing protein [Flavipsychrobacter sp.]|nr:DUF502 domain-containing protein [Flavipsychrobacter sp.]
MRKLASIIFRSFLQGLLILSPIAITAYVIYTVFDGVDSILVAWVPRGLGFVIIISVVTFIGYMGTRFFIGRLLFDGFDYLLEHIPGIRYLYTSIKDVMDSFVGDKKRFNQPVWVCTNLQPEIWRIGFMTQKDLASLGMHNKAAVYLPHSYAISGYVIVIEEKHIKHITKMNAAEAMKFAVSGGVASSIDEEKHSDKKFWQQNNHHAQN